MEFYEKGDKCQQALGVILLGQFLSHLVFLLGDSSGKSLNMAPRVLLFKTLVNGSKLRVAAAGSHRPGMGAAVTAPPHLSRQGRSYSNVLLGLERSRASTTLEGVDATKQGASSMGRGLCPLTLVITEHLWLLRSRDNQKPIANTVNVK